MKSGKTLTELATELDRQMKTKKDFIAQSTALTIGNDAETLLGINGGYKIGDLAHDQLAQRLEIPRKYYDRMRSTAPALLAQNANHWLHTDNERRMVRTLDGKVRAFLSDRFRPIDNYDVASAVLPTIQKSGCRIESCEVTERKMYLKVVTDRLTADIKKGDAVQAGLVISNSEVGCGAVKVEPMIFRLVCLNGMIAADASLRKYHVGRLAEIQDGAVEYFKAETMRADNKAFMMKIQDLTSAMLDGGLFNNIVEKMRAATTGTSILKPVAAIEEVKSILSLSETEGDNVLNHLIKGNDLSRYGLLNAVTAASQEVEDYDRATELEKIGGQILELPKSDWETIAIAA